MEQFCLFPPTFSMPIIKYFLSIKPFLQKRFPHSLCTVIKSALLMKYVYIYRPLHDYQMVRPLLKYIYIYLQAAMIQLEYHCLQLKQHAIVTLVFCCSVLKDEDLETDPSHSRGGFRDSICTPVYIQ